MNQSFEKGRFVSKNKKAALFPLRAIRKAYLFFAFLPLISRIKKSDWAAEDLLNLAYGKFNKLLYPMQVRSEIQKVLEIIKEKSPRVFVEIGTAEGGSLFLFSQTLPKDALIISLDLPGGKFGGGYSWAWWKIPLFKSFPKKGQKLVLIRKNSHLSETQAMIKNLLHGREIDFLFIDGDHTYEGAKKDYNLYAPLVKKGGLVALHDIAVHDQSLNCDVDRFWNELKNGLTHQELIENQAQGWAGIGIIQK
ncbi:MAG: methyltransferase [Candidatus Kerfeldbacteria bacterium CG_4_10_14_0_8_um_filter_42_10]|uniref:Methyltransferase n=1 Tax=Candidatus Kerfeldbacteria bacterium CG_4_10_14_0_8_um_filter_42_10 TaxID=2014248 RepID=A0A2M7RHI4_9BACT|nr:MAG: methyltransferase [Candidatus Kerfeldbacteria bacterium CG_4_10_14_0_8_um_filter_42_10]